MKLALAYHAYSHFSSCQNANRFDCACSVIYYNPQIALLFWFGFKSSSPACELQGHMWLKGLLDSKINFDSLTAQETLDDLFFGLLFGEA